MEFVLEHTDARTQARAGVIKTAHGEIKTPIFMPVGTQGTVCLLYTSPRPRDSEASRMPSSA